MLLQLMVVYHCPVSAHCSSLNCGSQIGILMCPDPTPVPAAALYMITMQVSVSAPYEYNCIVVTMFIIVTKLADTQLGNTPSVPNYLSSWLF
jgi:hypothetical protein